MIRALVYYTAVAITGFVVFLFGVSNLRSGDAPILTLFLLVGGGGTVIGAVYALAFSDDPEEYLPSLGVIFLIVLCAIVALFAGVFLVLEEF